TSLMFAAREIFLHALGPSLPLLGRLGVPAELLEGLKLAPHSSPTALWYSQIEALLQEYRTPLYEELKYRWAEPWLKNWLVTLGFAVGGLFYYLGMLVQALIEQGAYDQREHLPRFYVSGNGARIFDWFFAGRDKAA